MLLFKELSINVWSIDIVITLLKGRRHLFSTCLHITGPHQCSACVSQPAGLSFPFDLRDPSSAVVYVLEPLGALARDSSALQNSSLENNMPYLCSKSYLTFLGLRLRQPRPETFCLLSFLPFVVVLPSVRQSLYCVREISGTL